MRDQQHLFLDLTGRFFRELPFSFGKGFVGRNVLGPMLRGKGYQVIVDLKTAAGGRLYCNIDDWIPWNVYLFGRYQPERVEEAFMLRAVENCEVIFDIGANIGYYSVQFGRLVADSGRVYAFEPASYQFELLQRNLRLNGLGDRVETIKRVVSRGDRKQERIYFGGRHDSGLSSVWTETEEHEDVEATSVDEFCRERAIDHIDLVKIDVEGHELHVLQGMTEMLNAGRVRRIFVEVNDRTLSTAGTCTSELVSFLAEHRYRGLRIESTGLRPYKADENASLVLFKRV